MTLEATLASLPERFPGPGGAAAVLRDGIVLEAASWGWADASARRPFTAATPFPVCSITKQFTCATLLETVADPEQLATLLAARLPHLEMPHPSIASLCHNQSGLRDYWALAMLCGSPAEARFDEAAWRGLVARTRTLQFAPGTGYAYSNGNFRLLSDMLEEWTGRPFADLLRHGVLDRAGMEGARLLAETEAIGTIGHEGGVADGFRPAINRIRWTGDAGLVASLDDMIAWERFIDRTREDPTSPYRRLAAPVTFANGAPATYGFGLARAATPFGLEATGHGGGLRGFRSHRMRVEAARLSVVVLFNHMADPRAAALALLGACLDRTPPPPRPAPDFPAGRFVDRDRGLAATLVRSGEAFALEYGTVAEGLTGADDGGADARELAGPVSRIGRDGSGLTLHRPSENATLRLEPAGDADRDGGAALEGDWHCDELDCVLTIARAGPMLCGAFSGTLGPGTMERLVPFGRDIWRLPCPRALDYAPPGDWTLIAGRDAQHRVARIEVGCWLARALVFTRR